MNTRGNRARRWGLGIAAVSLLTPTLVASAGTQPAAVRFDKAKILIELNATARDAGVQMLIDGEDWAELELFAPNGRKLLAVTASGGIGRIGMTELFFESSEPSLDDLPLRRLLRMFPEGEYDIRGHTVDGQRIVGRAVLSHDIPRGPRVVIPNDGGRVDADSALIDWRPVTHPDGIRIKGYQIIVEHEEPLRVFSIDLPASITAVSVPAAFLKHDEDYKFEVIAISRGGNQTITESTFSTLQRRR